MTDRLLLRPFHPDDFESLLAIHSDPDVARYLYWEPRSTEQVRDLLQRKVDAATISPGETLSVAVTLRDDGTLIGDAVLQWASQEHSQGEIGFLFHPTFHGHGYATEAARALLQFAFEGLHLHRVIGRLEARNQGSAAVLERLGMRREAHLIENEYVKGEWQSELIYALLEREWRERNSLAPVAWPQPRRVRLPGSEATLESGDVGIPGAE